MAKSKIKTFIAAAALSAGALAFAGSAQAFGGHGGGGFHGGFGGGGFHGGAWGGGWHGGWHGGWPGHHAFRGLGGLGWGGYGGWGYDSPYSYSGHGNCLRRQWVWTSDGWRLQWVNACNYGW